MSIYFHNFGHAERVLKTCRRLLAANLDSTSQRVPKWRVFNALCTGFGYRNFDHLRLSISKPPSDSEVIASDDEYVKAFSLGFSRAIATVKEIYPSCPDDSEELCKRLTEEAFRVLVLEYRMRSQDTEEHQSPTQLEDRLAAVRKAFGTRR